MDQVIVMHNAQKEHYMLKDWPTLTIMGHAAHNLIFGRQINMPVSIQFILASQLEMLNVLEVLAILNVKREVAVLILINLEINLIMDLLLALKNLQLILLKTLQLLLNLLQAMEKIQEISSI